MERFTHDGLTFDVRDSADTGGGADTGTGTGSGAGTDTGSASDPGEAGEAVVLLHGFPQDSTAWAEVTPLLAAAGRRSLAPDLRGYSPRARPRERSAYRMRLLVGDVIALLDAAGLARAHVVGHDWGGALAWAVAMSRPERVARLTVLSTPHPAAMQWALTHSRQGLRSWYMLAFQVPVLPELVLGRALKTFGMRGLGLPEHHERAYLETLAEPGALSGALNWYRALSVRPGSGPGPGGEVRKAVTCPTTLIWGNRDPYLGREAAERTELYVDGPYRFVELDAGHWLPEKRADEVADAILEPVAPL